MEKAVAKDRARALRNRCTDAEARLWRHLKHSQLEGVKFRRQQPLEDFILDFVSFCPKVVIELDGGQHQEQQRYDARRDACLRKNGFAVLRFWYHDIFKNIEAVLEVIRAHCLTHPPPPPNPLPQGEGELEP